MPEPESKSPESAERSEPASETSKPPSNDPLHGVTLESILTKLEEEYGWSELGYRIRINCFLSEPSIKSSLKFLRKTPWARKKVEELYLNTFFR